jgi:dipeptidyl aminopeptidase/acylaminoacyl peptidase
LFLHGLHSSQDGYHARAERVVAELGATCLTVDLGGHGASEGDLAALSPRDSLTDAISAFDVLCAQPGVMKDRVGVCGASYGAYLASLLIARRLVARLVLRAPALYDDELLDAPLSRRGSQVGTVRAAAMLEGLRAYSGNVLVVESENDAVVGHDTIATYLGSIHDPVHRVIRGAGHELSRPESRLAFLDLVVEWFRGM